MIIFDANMILRYLLNDNEEMADIAENYLKSDKVYVTIEVIAEVVYVLKRIYSMERNMISDTIVDFLKLVQSRDLSVLNFALDTFKKYNLDFVDCVLYAYYELQGIEVATFDKKLQRLIRDAD